MLHSNSESHVVMQGWRRTPFTGRFAAVFSHLAMIWNAGIASCEFSRSNLAFDADIASMQDAQRGPNGGAEDCWDDTDIPPQREQHPQHEQGAKPATRSGGQEHFGANRAAAPSPANAALMQHRWAYDNRNKLPGSARWPEAGQGFDVGTAPHAARESLQRDEWQQADDGPQRGCGYMPSRGGRQLPDGVADRGAAAGFSSRPGWQQHYGGSTAADRTDQRWPAAAQMHDGAMNGLNEPQPTTNGVPPDGGRWGDRQLQQPQTWQQADDQRYRPPFANESNGQEGYGDAVTWLQQSGSVAPWEEVMASGARPHQALYGDVVGKGVRGVPRDASYTHHHRRAQWDDEIPPRGMPQPQRDTLSRRREADHGGGSHAGWAVPGLGGCGDGGISAPMGNYDAPDGLFEHCADDLGCPDGARRAAGPRAARGYDGDFRNGADDAGLQDGVDEFGVRDAAELFALGTQAQEPPEGDRWGLAKLAQLLWTVAFDMRSAKFLCK